MTRGASVLIAEDEAQAREALRQLLEDEGYRTLTAADGIEAEEIASSGRVEAVLLDIRMPRRDGLTILRALGGQPGAPAILVMTAYGTSTVAIEAMTLGAYDYLTKPIHFPELLIQLDRAIESRRRAADAEAWRAEQQHSGGELIGDSPVMQRLYKLIGQVAPADSTVLIRGESGTGKELIAHAIHEHSPRRDRRMVKVNCAAIPEPMLEAELFGYERGAFTGASQRRIGKFEYANGGTIFLDEVGEITPGTQTKLLRVLQERSIERLGSNATIALDIRVLAATNRDLESAVKAGEFREDLYYRLNVVTLVSPPLREHRADIGTLACHLLRSSAERLKLPAPRLTPEAIQALEAHHWPGNVRELEHALERALILCRGGLIGPDNFKLTGMSASELFDDVPLEDGLHQSVARLERKLISRALEAARGNRTRAAEILKINRRLLYDKIRDFNLE